MTPSQILTKRAVQVWVKWSPEILVVCRTKHKKPRKPQASRPLFYKLQASEVSHLIFHG
jgi:hypothetical protein